jgi:protein-S-isoprenylcysteine O-methyltransferase Ste14
MNDAATTGGRGRGKVALLVLSRFVPGFAAVGALIFAPAGSLAWGRGWIYLGLVAALLVVSLSYFLVRDPGLLEKRMRTREHRKAQKLCVTLSLFPVLAVFVVPGLDWRFGWSAMPAALPWIGLAAAAAGYALFFAVMRANSYASRIIEIQEGQRVIDTGPYAIVRHPMYCASILIYVASPLALGSWWALIPALCYAPSLVIRIRDEEAMLRRELPGYEEYCARTRWRLLPGLW